MTTENGQPAANETLQKDNQQPSELQPISLDAAAYVAATAKPTSAATGTDIDKTVADATATATPAAATLTEDSDFKELMSLNTEDLEKMLGEPEGKPAAAKTAEDGSAEGADTTEGGDADDAEEGVEATSSLSGAPVIPKPRFDAVNKKAKELETKLSDTTTELNTVKEQAAYYKGLAEGAKGSATAGTQPADTETPEHKAQAIREGLTRLDEDRANALLGIAEEFDAGKITLKEAEQRKLNVERNVKAIQTGLNTKLSEIEREANQPDEVDPQQIVQAINSDPRLVQSTTKLRQDNPWLDAIPKEAMPVLVKLAREEMAAKGLKDEPTPEATWQLRQHIAIVGKRLGYDRLSAQPAAASTTTLDGKTTTLTPEERKAKLDLAKGHPPAPGVGGVTAPGTDATGALLKDETVSVRELAAMLPTETFDKLLSA